MTEWEPGEASAHKIEKNANGCEKCDENCFPVIRFLGHVLSIPELSGILGLPVPVPLYTVKSERKHSHALVCLFSPGIEIETSKDRYLRGKTSLVT